MMFGNKKEMASDYLDNRYKSSRLFVLLKNFYYRFQHLCNLAFLYLITFVIAYVLFQVYLGPPRYSRAEHRANEKYFYLMLEEQAGDMSECIRTSAENLKKYPYFYNMVVDNIKRVAKFDNNERGCGGCPTYCASGDTLFVNTNIIESEKNNCPPSNISSTLIHEANHLEYQKSSYLRQRYLDVRCSPFINTNISVYSGYDAAHAFKPIEICAEREQNKYINKEFPELSNYLKHGVVYYFLVNMKDILKSILN